MNGDPGKTKAHLRISVDALEKIVEYLPLKHHGWSKEYELIFNYVNYVFQFNIFLW